MMATMEEMLDWFSKLGDAAEAEAIAARELLAPDGECHFGIPDPQMAGHELLIAYQQAREATDMVLAEKPT